MNTYKCVWLSKSFGEDLTIAYTWLGRHMLVGEREKQYSLNGSPERRNFVTFRERTVSGHFHSSQVPCACVPVMCTCLLTDPAGVTWARPSSSFSDQGPWQTPLGVPLAAIPSPVPSGTALSLSLKGSQPKECWIAGRWHKAEGAC